MNKTSGPSVTVRVVLRYRRPGKDKLSGLAAIIDCATNVIPDVGFYLPFID
jgi:hypothetical protein